MSTSRRAFLSWIAAATVVPFAGRVEAAEESGLRELLGGIADAATRQYAEKYRDDGRWDGKYYYDRYDNRRYTRDEWRREIERRARFEREGRDWRDAKRRAWEEKRYGKNYRQFRRNDDRVRRNDEAVRRRDEAIRRQDQRRAAEERRREEARARADRQRAARDAERVRRNDEAVRRRDEAIRRQDERRAQEERRRQAGEAIRNIFN